MPLYIWCEGESRVTKDNRKQVVSQEQNKDLNNQENSSTFRIEPFKIWPGGNPYSIGKWCLLCFLLILNRNFYSMFYPHLSKHGMEGADDSCLWVHRLQDPEELHQLKEEHLSEISAFKSVAVTPWTLGFSFWKRNKLVIYWERNTKLIFGYLKDSL